MTFEDPTLELSHGGGSESTAQGRDALVAERTSQPLPDFAELARSYPELADATCVFLSGSVTQGWGNETSDIDVFVVTKEPFDTEKSELLFIEQRVSTKDPVAWIAVGQLGAFRADIEIWHEAQVEELLKRFERDGSGHYRGYNGPFGFAERELFYRLTIGVPLCGEGWWSEKREAILGSDYRLWLAEEVKNAVENRLEDATGMLKAGDHESAVLAGYETLTKSLMALLATYGDFSQQQKWLYRRMQKYAPAEVSVEDAWKALSMAGCYEAPDEWVRKTTDLASRLILAVEQRMS
ncbi:nucleotidyltransferase domain-containing protein [Nonomuraea sp. NPDC050691]|uniref:nucleotidyltransferase domain-containing protein n=1 Tax=Nonomuraea sp. NPDC050691 TaxID=3155661 RepID=UPI0033EE49DD